MHAELATAPCGVIPTSLALRPSPTRQPLYTKLRLRALRVCSCTSKRPPRRIAATRNAHRVGCHVCLELPLLYVNSCLQRWSSPPPAPRAPPKRLGRLEAREVARGAPRALNRNFSPNSAVSVPPLRNGRGRAGPCILQRCLQAAGCQASTHSLAHVWLSSNHQCHLYSHDYNQNHSSNLVPGHER